MHTRWKSGYIQRTLAGLALGSAIVLSGCASDPGAAEKISDVLVIGDSMALGYGAGASGPKCEKSLGETARPDLAYGAVVATALGANLNVLAVPGHGLVRNYADAPGADMQTWLGYPAYDKLPPKSEAPGLVIIHLGTNDFYQHDPGTAFEEAYADLAGHILSTYPHARLVAMIGPMMGESDRARASEEIKAALDSLPARQAARTTFIHVDPKDLGPDSIGCDWRPTVAAHQKMAGIILSDLGLE